MNNFCSDYYLLAPVLKDLLCSSLSPKSRFCGLNHSISLSSCFQMDSANGRKGKRWEDTGREWVKYLSPCSFPA